MARFSLGCYTVRLVDKSTKENLPLGGSLNGDDLFTVFTQYLKARSTRYTVDSERQKLWRVTHSGPNASSVNGIVQTGEYGYAADLLNVDTQSVSYQRTGTDAEMIPFYFLAYLPRHLDEGVMLLQRRSNLGIRMIFLRDFASFLEESYRGKRVMFNPLVPPQLLNEYMQNGRLTKIRFIRYNLPSDLADAYDAGGHLESEGTAEMVFSPGRGRGLPVWDRLQDVLSGGRQINQLIKLPGYEYDNVKVEIDVRGSKKTLDLSDVMKMRAYVDITADLEIDDDGHPDFNSIDSIARDLLGSLLAELGTGNRDVR